MNFMEDEDKLKGWSCPSDRELTLRAKLSIGWSSRANEVHTPLGINESEQEAIMRVLERANKAQKKEEERIELLNDRLDKIKRQASGNGKKNCILCNDQRGFFSKFHTCRDCSSIVCQKCSVDTYELNSVSAIWLCKICSESREVLKKTNRWTQLCSQPAVLKK